MKKKQTAQVTKLKRIIAAQMSEIATLKRWADDNAALILAVERLGDYFAERSRDAAEQIVDNMSVNVERY